METLKIERARWCYLLYNLTEQNVCELKAGVVKCAITFSNIGFRKNSFGWMLAYAEKHLTMNNFRQHKAHSEPPRFNADKIIFNFRFSKTEIIYRKLLPLWIEHLCFGKWSEFWNAICWSHATVEFILRSDLLCHFDFPEQSWDW